MRKLFLLGLGVAAAVAFIGLDTVEHFVTKTRDSIREELSSPEAEMKGKLSEAVSLAEKCGDSIVRGERHVYRLDRMIDRLQGELARRQECLERDHRTLDRRTALLQSNHPVYNASHRRVSRRSLDRDVRLRRKLVQRDKELVANMERALRELKGQRAHTLKEIEGAKIERIHLKDEIIVLRAELENLQARRAVARTREESYGLDQTTFDRAREAINDLRASIAEEHRRFDFYARESGESNGVLPDDLELEPTEADAETNVNLLRK